MVIILQPAFPSRRGGSRSCAACHRSASALANSSISKCGTAAVPRQSTLQHRYCKIIAVLTARPLSLPCQSGLLGDEVRKSYILNEWQVLSVDKDWISSPLGL